MVQQMRHLESTESDFWNWISLHLHPSAGGYWLWIDTQISQGFFFFNLQVTKNFQGHWQS